jgi:hypothetical protein
MTARLTGLPQNRRRTRRIDRNQPIHSQPYAIEIIAAGRYEKTLSAAIVRDYLDHPLLRIIIDPVAQKRSGGKIIVKQYGSRNLSVRDPLRHKPLAQAIAKYNGIVFGLRAQGAGDFGFGNP